MAKNILLIHGLWLTPRVWDNFTGYFEERGYRVAVPGWPGIGDRTVEAVRKDPEELAQLRISTLVDFYAESISSMEEPPALIGHSMGGLIVQLLLDRGLGSAGVAIDSAAPARVLSFPISTMKAVSPALANPGNRHRAVGLTPKQFHYAFTNSMSPEASDEYYERYCIPAPGRIVFQNALGHMIPRAESRVNMRNSSRAPLLFVAGGADHTIPPQTNKANYRKQRKSAAGTEFMEFPGRNHLLLVQDGWDEIAESIEKWLEREAAR